MTTKLNRVLSILLVVAMMLSCTAVAALADTDAASLADSILAYDGYVKPDEDVTIQVFGMPFNGSGIQNDPLAQYIQDEFGIIVEWLPAAGDTASAKLSAMMAAGDLPDVVIFHNSQMNAASDAANAGMLLDLGDYTEQIPNVIKNASTSMKYWANSLTSDSTEYFAGVGLGNSVLLNDLNWSVALRADLYKELGYPEVASMMDLIPILEQMQELNPVNADGKKVYGLSLWPDWDSTVMHWPTQYMAIYGTQIMTGGYTAYNTATGEISSALAEDSLYFEGLEYLFKLNQAGLLDPDSVSQRFENATAKYTDGRVLTAANYWLTNGFNTTANAEEGKAFISVYPKDSTIFINPGTSTGTYPVAISATSDKKEYALKFLDFYFSPLFTSFAANGIEGEDWEMVDGSPVLTDQGWDRIKNADTTYTFYSHPALLTTFYDEYLGTAIEYQYWESVYSQPNANAVIQAYLDERGITQLVDQVDKSSLTLRPSLSLFPNYDDDTAAIVAKISPIVVELSWKMVFAEDEAEFEALKEEMIEKANDLGLQKVLDAGDLLMEQYLENVENYGDTTVVNWNI